MPFLDWVNKNQAKEAAIAVPYHLLNRDSVHGDATAAAENLLVQGDNLLALKALMPFYAGRVKCIFIDPPYNTQSAFEHYDDRLEHSQWLSMMYPRLVLLRELLAEDGSIWVTIDDNESHYLKVIMDEVFGRRNFVANVVWQKAYTSNQTALHISNTHDHILLYGKSADSLRLGKVPRTEEQRATFKDDGDPRGPWKAENLSAGKFYSAGQFPITGPKGDVFYPPKGRYWRCNEEQYKAWLADGRITFGLSETGRPMLKKYLNEMADGLTPNTWWEHNQFGSNKEASIDLKALMGDSAEVFGTPKPEKLLFSILKIATRPGDIVLDSFLGSGTTAAVAHKMGRRYVGIELGEHALTHCIPRLEKVIAGEQGGISKAVGWQGGGGFSFLTLGERAFDESGRINPAVEFGTLASYIWQLETGAAGQQPFDSPFLGVHDGKAYFLLYNGILGDRRPAGGNVLNSAILGHLRKLWPSPMPIVVYGETSRLGPARAAAEAITFKQIPYDISVR
ncbi:site-specific DNA-methyltransferase [Burkholderia pseudomallei]|nr:site-specific DNA-methyltransferase [Burkholderia pseudomallei]ALB95278.1 DNA methylase [Burkholderia pseudomallei]ALC01350.1 DNA methylase [Burkholderia pseudomallei]MBF3538350.1 site-specific DNA-methyltransferase [Burkholderia pseudomallei]MBF3600668.1 site-specific DNA-methyltransferase [Burkholderia pseudomallei]